MTMAHMVRNRTAAVRTGSTVKNNVAGAGRVEAIRRFNRFYTRKIGVLQEGLLGSAFSLTQGRALYEIAHREKPTATAVGAELGLDAGYLSRILRGFTKDR